MAVPTIEFQGHSACSPSWPGEELGGLCRGSCGQISLSPQATRENIFLQPELTEGKAAKCKPRKGKEACHQLMSLPCHVILEHSIWFWLTAVEQWFFKGSPGARNSSKNGGPSFSFCTRTLYLFREFYFIFFKRSISFIVLEREREREDGRRGRKGGRVSQADSPVTTKPNPRLDLMTLKSQPKQKPSWENFILKGVLPFSLFWMSSPFRTLLGCWYLKFIGQPNIVIIIGEKY